MTKIEMGEILAGMQELFDIHPDRRMDFSSDSGRLHSGRVLKALDRAGLHGSLETISELAERIDKTPPTAAKLVDSLIAEIAAAAEGDAIPRPAAPTFTGCDLCHDGVVVMPMPGGKHGHISPRAVYCDCNRGRFLHSANAETVCLAHRPELKSRAFRLRREDEARASGVLARFGVDVQAPEHEQVSQFREAVRDMAGQIGRSARQPRIKTAMSIEQAERAIAHVRPPSSPPKHLNPEAAAYAVYANGDERGEFLN